ncbi:hypothetical protein [Sphingomonas sp.]|uniref:hypothetical protein n=1 Tax=Sphingomonas sp. TaxID=28214 RepID=UPI001B1677D7|nr:hypothetical protein [Sphingomonas sp.]MBO9714245.1 hypothetical protein [Sphingomonas sp.]
MHLKIRRSQREGGVIIPRLIFCLDARVEFAAEERQNIIRHKLQNEAIYRSGAQRRAAEGSALAAANARARGIETSDLDSFLTSTTDTIGYGLKAVALDAVSRLRLTITVGTLERGQHIECRSMDELLGAEQAILTACENLKAYLDAALTFDGREMILDFSSGEAVVVAQASPEPLLAVPGALSRAGHAPMLAGPGEPLPNVWEPRSSNPAIAAIQGVLGAPLPVRLAWAAGILILFYLYGAIT